MEISYKDIRTAITIALAMVLHFTIQGQHIERSVIAAGGENQQAGNYTLNFTMGQPVASTLKTEYQLTQGFQQAWVIITAVEEETLNTMEVNVYPNPTVGIVHIDAPAAVQVSLFDINGKLLLASQIQNKADEMNLTSLAQGMYALVVEDPATKQRRTFAVNKL